MPCKVRLYPLVSFTTLNCHCADPVVCVPSSFFIGDNGIPLEVIAGSVSVEELVTRIHKVKQVMLTGWISQMELVMLRAVMVLALSLCLWEVTGESRTSELLVLLFQQ